VSVQTAPQATSEEEQGHCVPLSVYEELDQAQPFVRPQGEGLREIERISLLEQMVERNARQIAWLEKTAVTLLESYEAFLNQQRRVLKEVREP